MIRHIVIIHFTKSSLDYLALLEKTRALMNEIPGIISYQLFRNDSKYVPENIISIGVEIQFKDKHALDVFMEHPKHFEANAIFEKYLSDPPYMVLTHEI
ncbi:MAG: Dabb family protein [Chlamydiae bacterium]|nr:Dabb family protein [Chlamydiota bacterium]